MRAAPGILFVLWWLLCAIIAFGSLGLTIYGFCLAFSVSVLLGFACFFIPVAPLAFGVAEFFFHTNLPVVIMEFIRHTH